MKKLVAAAMSAALVTGSCFPAFAAESSVEMPVGNTIVSEFVLEAAGEAMNVTVNTEVIAEDFLSFSVNADVPDAGSFAVNDVARIMGDSFYINVDEIMSALSGLTEEGSLDSLPALVGITESWVEIPDIELEVPDLTFDYDAVLAELAGAAASFNVEESENGTVITFNGDSVVAALQALESAVDQYQQQQAGMFQQIMQLDFVTAFDEYITAAAEGINMADPSVEISQAKELISDTIQAVLAEASSSLTFTGLDTADGNLPSAEVAELLAQGVTIDGTIALIDTGFSATIDVTGTDGQVRSIVGVCNEEGFEFSAREGESVAALLSGTFSMTENGGIVIDMTAVEGEQSTPIQITAEPTENGFTAALSAQNEGETVAFVLDGEMTDAGASLALTVTSGEESVKFAAAFSMIEGVTVTDTTVPAATPMSEVVKNAVSLIYSMNAQETEE